MMKRRKKTGRNLEVAGWGADIFRCPRRTDRVDTGSVVQKPVPPLAGVGFTIGLSGSLDRAYGRDVAKDAHRKLVVASVDQW